MFYFLSNKLTKSYTSLRVGYRILLDQHYVLYHKQKPLSKSILTYGHGPMIKLLLTELCVSTNHSFTDV